MSSTGHSPQRRPATFYRRPLPEGLVAFASEEGKVVFREALAQGCMEGYFDLIGAFTTQAEPAYCGLGSLSMVLNACEVDPGRAWKGVWRWYSDDMLECCSPLEVIQKKGISADEFTCLATCNGLDARLYRWTDHPDQLKLISSCHPSSLEERGGELGGGGFGGELGGTVENGKVGDVDNVGVDTSGQCGQKSGHEIHGDHATNSPCCKQKAKEHYQKAHPNGFQLFIQHVEACCRTPRQHGHMVLTYSRKVLGQTGTGHFSPLGGYNPMRGLVLVLDVARFKYPAYWVSLETIW